MSKKKIVALVSALTLLLPMVFAGCSGNGGGGAGGKVDSSVLQIGVENKGYGDQFAYKLAEAFQAKTGIETKVVKSNSSDWTDTALLSGPRNNDIDVIFDINNLAMKNLAAAYFIDGYERAYADLSDIYDAPLEGYNVDKTLEEMVFPYSLAACTWGGEGEGYGDGKQYFVNWATGFEGLVYNKSLFTKYGFSVPKTTNEMFALMDQMKALSAKNADGYDIYPFAYSGKVNYLHYPQLVWWAQYDGIDTFNNILQGKDVNGNYDYAAPVGGYKYVKLELTANSKNFAKSEDPNQVVWTLAETWKTATITLTADTDHVDFFYNVADGRHGNVASSLLLDNIKASVPNAQKQLKQLNLAKKPVLQVQSIACVAQDLWHKFFKVR